MIQEDKELLLKDLCARLPYGVIVQCITESARTANASPLTETLNTVLYRYVEEGNIELKPYLRPMSSMTEEEIKEFTSIHENVFVVGKNIYTAILDIDSINWLLEHHFDFRGLIEKGLALEAPEGMYSISN